MKIGEYNLHSIVTSKFGLDGGAMFGIIPKPLWEKQIPADENNRIQMVTRSLVLIGEKRTILIETGNGTKWTEKFKNIYEIDTETVNQKQSLLQVGLGTEDITDVICTHLHFDHVGGNTEYQNGKVIPSFPDAKYWIHEENWKLANSPGEKDQGSFMEADWKVLAENNMIKLTDGPSIPKGRTSFLPGIDILVSNGHTTGQILPLIYDENHTLLYCADLIPTSAHIPIPWIMAYDIQPLVTIKEKHEVLSQSVENNWILFFEHDAATEACTVRFNGKHFQKDRDITLSRKSKRLPREM